MLRKRKKRPTLKFKFSSFTFSSILLILLLGILFSDNVPKDSSENLLNISPPSNQNPTQPTVESLPEIQPTTTPTIPSTQPPTAPPKVVYSDDPRVNAFIDARLETWICPVKDNFGEITGSRTFGSGRSGGKRAHAGLDFVAPHGTKVYAITSGTVQRAAPFYENTMAVEVLNDDGSVLRYCEIATNLKAGDYVRQGDVIGTILRADSGTEMLHMEVYMGDGAGQLTQSWNNTYTYVKAKGYIRRSDLLDPTFLKDLPKD